MYIKCCGLFLFFVCGVCVAGCMLFLCLRVPLLVVGVALCAVLVLSVCLCVVCVGLSVCFGFIDIYLDRYQCCKLFFDCGVLRVLLVLCCFVVCVFPCLLVLLLLLCLCCVLSVCLYAFMCCVCVGLSVCLGFYK